MPRREVFDLRCDLSDQGWKSLKHLAQVFGFRPDTVQKTVARHWKARTRPRGEMTKDILQVTPATLGLANPNLSDLSIRQEMGKLFSHLSLTGKSVYRTKK